MGLVPTLARPALQLASQGIGELDAGLLAGSMAAMLILFSVPVTLLGCVSPFAVRLAISDVSGSGQAAGRLYAVSTMGSILGAFLPVLLLIPNMARDARLRCCQPVYCSSSSPACCASARHAKQR